MTAPHGTTRMIVLRADDGDLLTLDHDRWHADADDSEEQLLLGLAAPVLDVGCGPGRVLAALGRRGIPCLGVDPAPGAVALARQRGGTVLQRSVFDRLPGEGRWGTVVLLDGNVGIGGDAVRLLTRCAELVGADGAVVVEVGPPGEGWRTRRVRLERGADLGPWFAWAVVGADAIAAVAASAGLGVRRVDRVGERWIAHLGRADADAA